MHDDAQRFSDLQLEQIIEEAAIYMCACPAQVAVQLRNLRSPYRYQTACEQDPNTITPFMALSPTQPARHMR